MHRYRVHLTEWRDMFYTLVISSFFFLIKSVDTEGSFNVVRLESMGKAMIQKCKALGQEKSLPAVSLTVEDILKNVFYYRVLNYQEQLSLISVLPSFLSANQKIKLIILDSVTAHFRHDFQDYAQRSRLLQGMAAKLREIASNFNVAIVMTNQVTTRFTSVQGVRKTSIGPALGDTWAQVCGTRVMLYWQQSKRFAHLSKSQFAVSEEVEYAISEEGLRSVNNNNF